MVGPFQQIAGEIEGVSGKTGLDFRSPRVPKPRRSLRYVHLSVKAPIISLVFRAQGGNYYFLCFVSHGSVLSFWEGPEAPQQCYHCTIIFSEGTQQRAFPL